MQKRLLYIEEEMRMSYVPPNLEDITNKQQKSSPNLLSMTVLNRLKKDLQI